MVARIFRVPLLSGLPQREVACAVELRPPNQDIYLVEERGAEPRRLTGDRWENGLSRWVSWESVPGDAVIAVSGAWRAGSARVLGGRPVPSPDPGRVS